MRVIANKLTREYIELENNGADTDTLEQLGAGKLNLATHKGDVEHGSVMGEAFELVWQMGACPQLSYRQDIWQFENSLEEAWAWYTGKIKTQRQITSAEEALVREYLKKIAVDGRIQEETKTTIVTMYWQV